MNKKPIIFLAVFFCILYAIGIGWGMPSEFVSEIDSEFPSGPFTILSRLNDNSYFSNYPVFHKLLMLPLYAVVLLALKVSGHLSSLSLSLTWPYGFSDPAEAMTLLILTARWVSLLMGVGTICILGLMVNRISATSNPRYRLLTFLPVFAFGFSGVVAYYSRTSTYDVPQLFWWVLSFFFLWNILFETTASRRDLVLSALFGAIATATKDQTVFFVAGSSVLLFFFPLSIKSFSGKVKNFLVYSIIATGIYAVAAVLVQPHHWISHMKQVLFLNVTSGQFAVYGGTISGQISLFMESLRCLSHVMTPWGLVFAAASIAVLILKRKYNVLVAIALPIVLTYVFIFAKIHFVFERYMLNYAFLFTLAVSYGINIAIDTTASQKLKYLKPALWVIVVCWLLHQVIFSFIPLTYAQFHDTKKQLSRTLAAVVPDRDTLSWEGSIFSLPNADVYTHYRFAVPDTVLDSLYSFRISRVFVRSNATRTYVLSDRDLFSREKNGRLIIRKNWVDTTGLKLLASVQAPLFIQNNIKVYSAAQRVMTCRVSIPYYLYKMDRR
jgi:hypothetical protein